MVQIERHSRWMFIILPALAMMLGWGLRGHIGGGTGGAMIPGAMVALTLSLLLKLPAAATSIIVVFGIFGIGMGGQMTYGQTLGFLMNPETVWWGNIGTTLKGAIWGLMGGAILSLGFVYKQLSEKTIIVALLLMMTGMLIGFKLINDPMIIYFSDPENPRRESWAGLLSGAVVLLSYFKFKTSSSDFKIIFRFALLGMIGGGLGFGLGGYWMVLNSYIPLIGSYIDLWKAMEFTFGLLLGAFLGYAGWLSRKELKICINKDWAGSEMLFRSAYKEFGAILLVLILGYWLIPYLLRLFAGAVMGYDGFIFDALQNIARIMGNFAFRGGLVFVLVIMLFPKIAWQLGITLTFYPAAINLMRTFYPEVNSISFFTIHGLFAFLLSIVIVILVAYFSRKEKTVLNMFLLLTWSCIAVSLAKLTNLADWYFIDGLSAYQMFLRKYLIDIFFVVSGIIVTWIAVRQAQTV